MDDCLIRLGDDEAARRELDLCALLAQADELRSALVSSHDKAVAVLDRWTAETAKALGVADLEDG